MAEVTATILLQEGVSVGLGALVLFLGILLWSRTREASWMLVILAVLVWYVGLVVRTLQTLGVLGLVFDEAWMQVTLDLVLDNLWPLLLGLGIFLALRNTRLRR